MAKRKPEPEPLDDAVEQTSVRINKGDARDLKALAGLMDVSIPEAYRMVCARVVSGADVAKFVGDGVETIFRTYVHAGSADPADAMDKMFGGG